MTHGLLRDAMSPASRQVLLIDVRMHHVTMFTHLLPDTYIILLRY